MSVFYLLYMNVKFNKKISLTSFTFEPFSYLDACMLLFMLNIEKQFISCVADHKYSPYVIRYSATNGSTQLALEEEII